MTTDVEQWLLSIEVKPPIKFDLWRSIRVQTPAATPTHHKANHPIQLKFSSSFKEMPAIHFCIQYKDAGPDCEQWECRMHAATVISGRNLHLNVLNRQLLGFIVILRLCPVKFIILKHNRYVATGVYMAVGASRIRSKNINVLSHL